ncbi:MAG: hypothetical protein J6B21_04325 [Oscillospiraceae bacterium]|nr:hypothetical protein [Oscillospiraceae bacterium]
MKNYIKSADFEDKNFPFGIVEVKFPPKDTWDITAFRRLVDSKIALLKEQYTSYDRKAVFGENPYVKFFKKFKKTYPVMLQFESVCFKDRPFPAFNPISEIAFLAEITTFVLSGTHDIDSIIGDVQLYLATEKEDFEGMHGTLHTYPNDFCAKDDKGIIFSLIAGTDSRTCAKQDSSYALYPVFGTPDIPLENIEKGIDTICRYVKVLAPDAKIETAII